MRSLLASMGFWQGVFVLAMSAIAWLAGTPAWAVGLIAILAITVITMSILYQIAVRKSVKRALLAFREFTGQDLRCRGIGLRYYLLCMRRAIKEMGVLLEEARKAESKAIRGIASTGYGIIVFDREGKVLMANEKARELIGATESKGLWEAPGASRGLVETVEAALNSGKPTRAEFLVLFPERRWIRADIAPFSGESFLLVVEDITPVKDTESIKSRLVSSVSHELRTPITVIQGYLELASDPSATELARANAIETAMKHTKRLSAIVEDLLTLSRMESVPPNPEPIDPRRLLSEAEEMFRPKARQKGLDLVFRATGLPETLRMDPGIIETALYNIIDNAIKFTQAGSVEVEAWAEGGWLFIRVSDTGPGIPPDDIPRIFERFYKGRLTSQADVPGTGLGLAIAKWAVSSHGGEILTESRVGEGTSFTLKLPVA
ncbi:MAG: sensor histidine kinase [candidate division WOR-3 bacterium]